MTPNNWRKLENCFIPATTCFVFVLGKTVINLEKMNWTAFDFFWLNGKMRKSLTLKGERDTLLIVSCADTPHLHSTFTQFLGIFLLVIVFI